jgi:adenylate cyclase, class 2
MVMGQANQEVEIKLGVPDARRLRLQLKLLRARVVVPRTYESNTLYDTPSRSLTRHGQMIRIRMEQPSPNSRNGRSGHVFKAVLTYKGPLNLLRTPQSSHGKAGGRTRYKIRKEIEVVVGDARQMSSILQSLGFRPVFRYEKLRTTYALPGVRGVKVEFDETPVGLYLELEGNVAAIDRAAGRLGYSADQYLTSTYGDIYLAECRRRKRKPTDMLFPPTKKLR